MGSTPVIGGVSPFEAAGVQPTEGPGIDRPRALLESPEVMASRHARQAWEGMSWELTIGTGLDGCTRADIECFYQCQLWVPMPPVEEWVKLYPSLEWMEKGGPPIDIYPRHQPDRVVVRCRHGTDHYVHPSKAAEFQASLDRELSDD